MLNKIQVDIVLDCWAPSGYGKAGRDYIIALDDIGVDVRPVFPKSTWDGSKIDKKIRDRLLKLSQKIRTGKVLTIENMVPELQSDSNNIAYTVWETTRCPPGWKNKLNKKKAILTCSLSSKQGLIAGGVKVPIYVVPHIVEIQKKRSVKFDDLKGKVFLTIGEYTYRKNMEDLLYAFLVAMNGKDDVTLILKTCALNPGISGMKIKEFLNRAKARAIVELKEQGKEIRHPRVIVNDKILEEEYIHHYYQNADYYITTSFGEAWNLPLSEAMANGLVPIAPFEGGHRMFCTDENAILMQGDWVKAGGVDGNSRYDNAGDWYKITPETIMDAITFAYENDVSYIGAKAKAFVEAELNPRKVAAHYAEVLCQIDNPVVGLHKAEITVKNLDKLFVVKCVQALNEVDWIEKQLENRYKDVDLILVTEGGVPGRPDVDNGHSVDGTLEKILNFAKDPKRNPDNKIAVFTKRNGFDDYEDIKNTFTSFIQSELQHIEGKIVYISDVDEFMTEDDYKAVIEEFILDKDLSEVVPKFLHFYRFMNIIERPLIPSCNIQHQRFTRWQPEGMWYFSHPTLTSVRDRVDTACHPAYQAKRKVVDNYIYHIGGVKPREFYTMKHNYYLKNIKGYHSTEHTWKSTGELPVDKLMYFNSCESRPIPQELVELQLPVMSHEGSEFPKWDTSPAYSGEIETLPLFTAMDPEVFIFSE